MKITIDTTNKTLIVDETCSVEELTKFMREHKLKDYNIISAIHTLTYPYAPYPIYTESTPSWEVFFDGSGTTSTFNCDLN